ncbi:MAG: Rrf2 family transcriptional regulator [Deltaproteobacteria bacterium]|nr:Rrf2 family transcriptional regulator [Deltaproteobacteria bacterium]
MKLSTRTRYGTRLLFDLARHCHKGPVQIGEVARRQNISVKYLEQIIRPLKKAELVFSVRGPKGGHVLAKSPDEISLGQIVRLLESNTELVDCVSNPADCEMSDDCRVRFAWQEATRVLYDKLDSITISDLLSNEGQSDEDGPCPPFGPEKP